MKKVQAVVVVTLLLGLFFSAANVFATPLAPDKPKQTPGAHATEIADQHDNQGNQGNENDDDQGNGQGPKNTPGAKATEKADQRETQAARGHKGARITYRGTVTAVGTDSLTLSVSGGGTMTFHVGPDTRIHIPTEGKGAALAEVNVGVQALVQVLQNDATDTALFITVVPGKPEPVHRVGIVTAYAPGSSITVEDKKGQSSTFLITPDTKILPKNRASQLGVGSLVTIISSRDVTGGPLTAEGIVVHPQPGTPTATATGAASEAATATPTATDTPTDTPTTVIATATDTPTDTPTSVPPTATDTPTETPTSVPHGHGHNH